jgi:hypothetical protein
VISESSEEGTPTLSVINPPIVPEMLMASITKEVTAMAFISLIVYFPVLVGYKE